MLFFKKQKLRTELLLFKEYFRVYNYVKENVSFKVVDLS
ncbi:hypothetical protein SAMN05518672_1011564 [Chitinophaga sp. CF118]|nr:hypothetical protein SAMN05518672_1011564 [Chitinophaga sp. CF118]